jgi:hypothetical protein
MNLPLHFLRPHPSSNGRGNGTQHSAQRPDLAAGKTIFRAPALPTPQQMSNELPFTVNLRPRLRDRP